MRMKNTKVIIVDDESRIRRGIEKLILSNGEEWEIVGTYANGQECLNDVLAHEIFFDVLFTDMKMPLMNGLELLTKLKKSVSHDYHSVVISGFDDFEFVQKAMRQGTIDYLLKPIDRQEMQRCLNNIKSLVPKVGEVKEAYSKNVSIELATQWILENLGETITIEKIASKVFMNPTYFSEYFKRKTGETVLDFVTKKRMEKALQLLQSTNIKIYEISLVIGYSDTKYFSKLFKRYYGVLPSQVRHQ